MDAEKPFAERAGADIPDCGLCGRRGQQVPPHAGGHSHPTGIPHRVPTCIRLPLPSMKRPSAQLPDRAYGFIVWLLIRLNLNNVSRSLFTPINNFTVGPVCQLNILYCFFPSCQICEVIAKPSERSETSTDQDFKDFNDDEADSEEVKVNVKVEPKIDLASLERFRLDDKE